MSRRRGVAKLGTKNAPVKSARKKAKAAEPTLSTAWQSFLTTSSSLFEFIGDLAVDDEEVAEQCATVIVELTRTASGSARQRFDLTKLIGSRMKILQDMKLPEVENNEEKKKRSDKTRELIEAQLNVAFAVCEEVKTAAPASGAHPHTGEYCNIYANVIQAIQSGVLLLVNMDEESGWEYFDTISLRFFTAAVIVTAEKFASSCLFEVVTDLFDSNTDDPLLGQYLRRDNIASAACVTLLVDWFWKSFSQCAAAAAESNTEEMTEDQEDQEDFAYEIKEVLKLMIWGTLNSDDGKSPIVSTLIKRAQQTLNSSLSSNSSSLVPPSSSLLSNSPDHVSCRTALEFFNNIQGARSEEMFRLQQVMIDADEMAVTVPLIIRAINSSSCSVQNRKLALYCLRTFIHARIARDEFVRLGYLKSMLDTVVPYILGTKQVSDVAMADQRDYAYETSIRSVFDAIVKNDPVEKSLYIRLADIPREYVEIDSSKNLMKSLFHLVQSEVSKFKASSKSSTQDESAQHAARLVQYVNCLINWYDSLVRAQTEDSRQFDDVTSDDDDDGDDGEEKMNDEKSGKEESKQKEATKDERKKLAKEYAAQSDANIAAGRSAYMTMSLVREMYDYFIDLIDNLFENDPQDEIESIESFGLRTAATVMCARLLTEPITPTEYIEEKVVQLVREVMIDGLMQKSSMDLRAPVGSWDPIELHKSIHECRARIHTALGLLAEYEFKRDSAMVESQVDLLVRVVNSAYGNPNATEDLQDEIQTTLMGFIDQERVAALRCFHAMIDNWPNEEVKDISLRVFTMIKTSHHTYFAGSQKCALEVVGLLMDFEDVISDTAGTPERGVDLVLSVEASQFLITARQLLIDVILHTPKRTLAKLAFEQIAKMIVIYGQVALTQGEIKLLILDGSSFGMNAPLPALTAYTRVCRMFLTSRLLCQNTSFRRGFESTNISYIQDMQLPEQTVKAAAGSERFKSGSQNGGSEDEEMKGDEEDDDEDDPFQDEDDEQPLENVDLMMAFFATIHSAAQQLSSAQYLSSILTPILPSLNEFHLRSQEHEISCAAFVHNVYESLGDDLLPHRDSLIQILASCFMSVREIDPSKVHLADLQQTARQIMESKPKLNLKKVLPEEEVRECFEQTIAQ